MDPLTYEKELAATVVGGVAGFIGGSVSALTQGHTPRRAAAAILGGIGFGSFLPPALMAYTNLTWSTSGLVGFVAGLGVYGLTAGLQRLAGRFADHPERFLPPGLPPGLQSPPVALPPAPPPVSPPGDCQP